MKVTLALLCLSLLIPAAASANPGKLQTLVVGGSKASADESIVALFENKKYGAYGSPKDRFFCTGTLIAPDVVITAAHCVIDSLGYSKKARLYTAAAGSTYLNAAKEVDVTEINIIPDYLNQNVDYARDVAILKLESPLENRFKQIIPKYAKPTPGSFIIKYGYGIDESGFIPGFLKKLIAVQQPARYCGNGLARDYLRSIGKNRFYSYLNCLGSYRPGAVCSGDSGGPGFVKSRSLLLASITNSGIKGCPAWGEFIDSDLSNPRTSDWIKSNTIRLSGVNPISTEIPHYKKSRFCVLKSYIGKRVKQVRRRIRHSGCIPFIRKIPKSAVFKTSVKYTNYSSGNGCVYRKKGRYRLRKGKRITYSPAGYGPKLVAYGSVVPVFWSRCR